MKIGPLDPEGARVILWLVGGYGSKEHRRKSANISILLSVNSACLTYIDKWVPGQFMGENRNERLPTSISGNCRGVRHEALKLHGQTTRLWKYDLGILKLFLLLLKRCAHRGGRVV